ncbi:hypothetical protein D3H65_11770 [Paraflavitalea soli]|uniref:Uncharacterized protein n=1 Tax=Paraflavitalea soli TaxID=2315862 RepID=A0A3B7MLM4_9BACT|nr:hypothetical protein [Paraflavitalea soli]AXY74617.1 hypothetical protein D3H65_11770 [Paraflavitalea soli]
MKTRLSATSNGKLFPLLFVGVILLIQIFTIHRWTDLIWTGILAGILILIGYRSSIVVSYDEQYLYVDRFRWDEEKISYTAIVSIARYLDITEEDSPDDGAYNNDMEYEITYIDHAGVERSRHFQVAEQNIELWNKVKATILRHNPNVIITE